MPMHFKFVRSGTLVVETGRTSNIGYDYEEVVAVLARLDAQGSTHEEVDSDALANEELQEIIAEVRVAYGFRGKSRRGRKVASGVYGSRKDPWPDFGKGVPSLVVYDKGDCMEAYPHLEIVGCVTIADYLACIPSTD